MASTTIAPRRAARAERFSPFDRMIDDLFGRVPSGLGEMDVVQGDDGLTIRADMPGIPADEISVEIDRGILTISGSHEDSEEKEDERYVRRERRSRHFQRSVTLPAGADAEAISAHHKDGVLEVKVPVAPAGSQARTITPTTE